MGAVSEKCSRETNSEEGTKEPGKGRGDGALRRKRKTAGAVKTAREKGKRKVAGGESKRRRDRRGSERKAEGV